MIVLRYETVDHVNETRSFKTIEKARAFAHSMVTATPEVSLTFNYAVAPDGVGKITPERGCTMKQLFPDSSDADPSRW